MMIQEALGIGSVLLKENIRIISFYLRFIKVEKVWVLDSQQKDE